MTHSPSFLSVSLFAARGFIAFFLSIVVGLICLMIGAGIGGSIPASETLRIGSRVGYEITGIVGFDQVTVFGSPEFRSGYCTTYALSRSTSVDLRSFS